MTTEEINKGKDIRVAIMTDSLHKEQNMPVAVAAVKRG